MKEKKPEKFTREWFIEQGKLGAKKRYEGKTKEEISEIMVRVRAGKKINK